MSRGALADVAIEVALSFTSTLPTGTRAGSIPGGKRMASEPGPGHPHCIS